VLGALVALVLVLTWAPTVAGAAAPTSIEVHWDALSGSTFKRAGDFTSDFSPVDAGNGGWQLLPTAASSPELGFIKATNTGSGTVEVHLDTLAGSGYTRVGDFASDFSPADDANGAFMLFGSANGAPELGFVKLRNTAGTVEVHWDVLTNGAYRRAGDATSDFTPADAGNGVWDLLTAPSGTAPELGFIKVFNTPGTVEAHWDTLAGSTYRRAGDATSDFIPADNANGVWQLIATPGGTPQLGFIKLHNTGSGTVEGHWDSLVGTTFKRAGDAASDFSLADAGNGVWQFVAASGAPELGFVKLRAPAAKPVVLPPPTTVSTPVTVVLPLPTGRRHVRVKITIGWTWNGGRTRLSRIRIGHVPARATVTVTCKGPGCPKPHTRRARGRRVKTLVAHLHGGRYRAGDRLFVTISAPGLIAERAEITIRNGELPRVRALR
jgi:hypothetical protein